MWEMCGWVNEFFGSWILIGVDAFFIAFLYPGQKVGFLF
jgi:hypothetical protein